MVTNNSCDYQPTQYNVLSGGANGTINNISPSTSGFVLTSNGTSAQPSFQAAAATGITTLDGDTGSATGSTITFNAQTNAGSSISFSASGTSVDLITTDVNDNTILGFGSGNGSISGAENVGLGKKALHALTSGAANVAIGWQALETITADNYNCAVGAQALQSLVGSTNQNTAIGTASLVNLITGGFNTCLGYFSGTSYTGAESGNILIGAGVNGTAAESFVTRIGSGQSSCFISGISGVSVSNLNMVTINTSTGQLGSQAFVVPALTITPVAHAASPYTVLSTDQFLAVDASGGVVTIKLPNAPTTGRVIYIKDSKGSSATSNITITTVGGSVTIDGATSITMNTNYASINVVFDGTSYEVF